MAITDRIEAGQAQVVELRSQLDRVREALDRTDAVLGSAEEALAMADEAVATSRTWAPRIAVALGVVAAVAVTLVVVKRVRGRREPSAQ